MRAFMTIRQAAVRAAVIELITTLSATDVQRE
jgi:hypothetical protein